MDNLSEIRPIHLWVLLAGPALGAFLGSVRFGLGQKHSTLYPEYNARLMAKAGVLITLLALFSCLMTERNKAFFIVASAQGPVLVLLLQQFLSRPMEGAFIGTILQYLLFQIFLTTDGFLGFSPFWWYLLVFVNLLFCLIPLLLEPLNSFQKKCGLAWPWLRKSALIWLFCTLIFSLQKNRRPLQVLNTEIYQWEGARAALLISFAQSQPEQILPFQSHITTQAFYHILEDDMDCESQAVNWAFKPVVRDHSLLIQFLKCDATGKLKPESSPIEIVSELSFMKKGIPHSNAPKRIHFDALTGILEYESGSRSTMIFPGGTSRKGTKFELTVYQKMQMEKPNGRLLRCPENPPETWSSDWNQNQICPRIYETENQIAYLDQKLSYRHTRSFRIGIVNLQNPEASEEWKYQIPEDFHLNHSFVHENRLYLSFVGKNQGRILKIYALNQSHPPMEYSFINNLFQYRMNPSEKPIVIQSPILESLETEPGYPVFQPDGIQIPFFPSWRHSGAYSTELEIFLPYSSEKPSIHSFEVPSNHSYYGIRARKRAVLLEKHLSDRLEPSIRWKSRDWHSLEVLR